MTILFLITSLILLLLTFREYQPQSPEWKTYAHAFLGKTRNATNAANKTNTIANLTKVIVVSHHNEDLSWLDLFIGEQIPHVVYTRSTDPLTRHNIHINKGREAAAYLQYIVDFYSNLPSLIAFVHGHRTAWHQRDPSDIVVALRALQWNKYTYMPLTSAMTTMLIQPNTTDSQIIVNYELWEKFLQKELGSPPKNGIKTHCCATFVVRKEAILAHPRSFYANIMDYILITPYPDQLTARTLEYTWHLIFGEPAHINYKTCDIFVCDSNGTISVELAEKSQ